jgi:hypothetical protein
MIGRRDSRTYCWTTGHRKLRLLAISVNAESIYAGVLGGVDKGASQAEGVVIQSVFLDGDACAARFADGR